MSGDPAFRDCNLNNGRTVRRYRDVLGRRCKRICGGSIGWNAVKGRRREQTLLARSRTKPIGMGVLRVQHVP